MDLGLTRIISKNINDVDKEIRDSLQEQGFGIITEIDVKKTFKKKINKNFQEYRILGACNPEIAHEALSINLDIGLLLPCNVVLWDNGNNSTTVSVINAEKMLSLADEDELLEPAKQVNTLLKKAIDSL
ncbi:MAG TPA: DUF302 domain-containing protein [Alphaproteobacteria bacterium]|jgi:uncharacterized protein (DUF302 family)|nr:DUF302 domain-containing protein [Alphaproteobacteria bacterium]